MTSEQSSAAREQDGSSCPGCGSQGFDGQGYFQVAGTWMYALQCWECGTRFAVEDDEDTTEMHDDCV